MRVTVLSENTTSTPLCRAEHGLSLYIETASKRILFDMGQSDLFAKKRYGVRRGCIKGGLLCPFTRAL